jgi:transposase-like protein
MSKTARVFSREMKLAALRRMAAGENVSALARELKLRRKLLYAWRDNFRSGGPDALRPRGRPRKSAAGAPPKAERSPAPMVDELAQAKRQVAELERKIGQQQVEIDFFRQALRQVREARQVIDGPGAKSSTPRSKR